MDNKIYIVRTECGMYITESNINSPRKEKAKLFTWSEAEEVKKEIWRSNGLRVIIESKSN